MFAGHALADRLIKRASKIMGFRGILISVLRNSFGYRGVILWAYAPRRFLLSPANDDADNWIATIMTQDFSIIRPDLIARIHALCDGEDDSIAIMATVSAELFHAVDGFDWVGFYRVVAPDVLKIGPYPVSYTHLTLPTILLV